MELLLECEKDIAKVLMCGAGEYTDNNIKAPHAGLEGLKVTQQAE